MCVCGSEYVKYGYYVRAFVSEDASEICTVIDSVRMLVCGESGDV